MGPAATGHKVLMPMTTWTVEHISGAYWAGVEQLQPGASARLDLQMARELAPIASEWFQHPDPLPLDRPAEHRFEEQYPRTACVLDTLAQRDDIVPLDGAIATFIARNDRNLAAHLLRGVGRYRPDGTERVPYDAAANNERVEQMLFGRCGPLQTLLHGPSCPAQAQLGRVITAFRDELAPRNLSFFSGDRLGQDLCWSRSPLPLPPVILVLVARR